MWRGILFCVIFCMLYGTILGLPAGFYTGHSSSVITTWWYNIYDSNCVVPLGDTSSVGVSVGIGGDRHVCIGFLSVIDAFLRWEGDIVYYVSGKEFYILRVLSETLLSGGGSVDSFEFIMYAGDVNSQFAIDNNWNILASPIRDRIAGNVVALTGIPPCLAPSLRLSYIGLTHADCCIDDSFGSCPVFLSQDYSHLDANTGCVASYFGYGSVIGTPCEIYYSTESQYYTAVEPAETARVFTDFGSGSVRFGFDCYLENWAHYRTNSGVYGFDYFDPVVLAQSLIDCDSIRYGFLDFGSWLSGTLREVHDVEILGALQGQGSVVWLTIGGWNALGTPALGDLLHQIVADSNSANFLLDLVSRFALAGIDWDIEWPGLRGHDPAFVPELVAYIVSICETLINSGSGCEAGVLPAGDGYNPVYYSSIASYMQRFNVFGYDYHGCWENALLPQEFYGTPSSSVYAVSAAITRILAAPNVLGFQQLALGIPAYIRGYTIALITDNVISALISTGCFPPSSESSLVEDGVGTLSVRDGDFVPTYCLNHPCVIMSYSDFIGSLPHIVVQTGVGPIEIALDPSTFFSDDWHSIDDISIATSPDYLTLLPDNPTFLIPFRNVANLHRFVNQVHGDFGISNFFVYAYSMNPVTSALMRHTVLNAVDSRQKRSVATPSYAFPHEYAARIDCVGIMYYSPLIIVTAPTYEGCYRPEGLYCYYPADLFVCQTAVSPVKIPETISEPCIGVDTVTLLPSSSESSRVACVFGAGSESIIKFYTRQTSVCADSSPTLVGDPQHIVDFDVNIFRGFEPKLVDTYGDPELHYSVLFIPKLCESFVVPLSCIEFLCRNNFDCVGEIQNSPFISYCHQVADILTDVENAISQIQSVHARTLSIVDKLRIASAKYSVTYTISGRRRKKRGAGVVASLVGMGLAGIFGYADLKRSVKQNADNIAINAQNIQLLSDKQNALIDRVNELSQNMIEQQEAHNRLVDTVDLLAEETSNRFDEVAVKINEILAYSEQLEARLSRRFASFDSQIAVLTDAVSDNTEKISFNAEVSAGVSSYTVHLLNILSKLQIYKDNLLSLQILLTGCLNSLTHHSFIGCVEASRGMVPLSIEEVAMDTGTALVFTYFKRELIRRETFYSATFYCQDNIVYVAAAGCNFILINDTTMHATSDMGFCDDPFITYNFVCDTRFVAQIFVPPSHPPVGNGFPIDIGNVSSLEQELADIRAEYGEFMAQNITSLLETNSSLYSLVSDLIEESYVEVDQDNSTIFYADLISSDSSRKFSAILTIILLCLVCCCIAGVVWLSIVKTSVPAKTKKIL